MASSGGSSSTGPADSGHYTQQSQHSQHSQHSQLSVNQVQWLELRMHLLVAAAQIAEVA